MSKILQTNPKSVHAHKDLVMNCLDDKDESIRLRALNLLYGMVSKKTLMEIIKKLMHHVSKAEGTHYRDELLAKIIDICSQNNYQYVTNFEWYVTVLVELARMDGTKHGKLIAAQLLDVAIRVESVREFCVKQMSILIENINIFGINTIASTNLNICEVLFAATWICGEFSKYLEDPIIVMNSMLKTNVTALPGHIQAAFVQNIFKLYAVILNKHLAIDNDIESGKELTKDLIEKIQIFEQSSDLEVQERACSMLQMLKYVQRMLEKDDISINDEIQVLFEGELNPIAAKAQKKVPIPEGLDLDEWINDPPSESEEEKDEVNSSGANKQIFSYGESTFSGSQNRSNDSQSSSMYHISSSDYHQSYDESKDKQVYNKDDLNKRKEQRKLETESNPFYIKGGSSNQKVS
jgi:AP-3 complex subunit delta-1